MQGNPELFPLIPNCQLRFLTEKNKNKKLIISFNNFFLKLLILEGTKTNITDSILN